MRKNILLTNDDGIESSYTSLLSKYLKLYYNVFEFIPQKNKSGLSGSLSEGQIRIDEISRDKYTLSGTPVECVIFGMKLMRQKFAIIPEIIISGPNNGLNYGKTSFYSGTFMAANEGFQSSVNSISISLEGSFSAQFFMWLSGLIFEIENKGEVAGLLNININMADNNDSSISVIKEEEIIEHDFSLFEFREIDSQFKFFKKRIDNSDKASFISISYYFDSNAENKEKILINLVKNYVRRNKFDFS
ncbi:5'/3'-nucleotidase SurE [Streptococcus oralis]|uniref:5'/3'-nucleotidase SurE n=1 Tax=Streptococcus oralis TaxID=1303 RepID=UPI00228414F6|nr:5'/3'-nucleotidase SurE [Streptococcus oralis]MCY7079210.1 5'/3'-nucleotidase SurE [Streptococcus oralis]